MKIMRNTLRGRGELRATGALLSAIGLLGLAGCASDQEAPTQPIDSASATAKAPAPEAVVQPTEAGSAEGSTSTFEFKLSPEVGKISRITSLEEANRMMESYVAKSSSAGESNYLTTNDILVAALETGDLEPLARDYAVDKDEIDRVISSLSSLLSSQEDKVKKIDESQIQILMEKHLAYTPIDVVDGARANIALLDAVRQHPNYESAIPDIIDSCEGNGTLNDRMVAEPLGHPLSREMYICEPDSAFSEESATFFRSPQGIVGVYASILDGIKSDPSITTKTVEIMTEWYDEVLKSFIADY